MPPEVSPQLLYSTNAELGEVDTTEDAIDGMGAIQFTDEEDCGYFGQSNLGYIPCLAGWTLFGYS